MSVGFQSRKLFAFICELSFHLLGAIVLLHFVKGMHQQHPKGKQLAFFYFIISILEKF